MTRSAQPQVITCISAFLNLRQRWREVGAEGVAAEVFIESPIAIRTLDDSEAPNSNIQAPEKLQAPNTFAVRLPSSFSQKSCWGSDSYPVQCCPGVGPANVFNKSCASALTTTVTPSSTKPISNSALR